MSNSPYYYGSGGRAPAGTVGVPRNSPYYYGSGGRAPARPRGPYPKMPAPRAPAVQQPGQLLPPAPPAPVDTSSFGAQAAAEAQRQIDPILALITQRANAQAQYSQAAIAQVTNQYAGALGDMAGQFSAAYAPEIKSSQALGGGLKSFMTGAGKTAAATEAGATGLAGKSAGSDVPLAAEGAGAGKAAEAIQAGMTQALKTAQSAAVKYASALPGFAQKEGQMTTTQVLQEIAGRMADQLAETTAQAPAIYHQVYNELLDRAENDRSFQFEVAKWKYGVAMDQQDRADAAAKQRASIVGPQAPTLAGRKAYWDDIAAKRTASSGQEWVGTTTGIRPLGRLTLQGQAAKQAGVKVEQGAAKIQDARAKEIQRHNEALAKIAIQRRNADTTAANAAVTAANAAETHRHNVWVEQHPKLAKAPKPKAVGTEVTSMVNTWYKGKPSTRRVTTKNDKTGKISSHIVSGPTVGQVDYQTGYRKLRAMGYDDKRARALLDANYHLGERGRPWVNSEARNTLKKKGLTPHPRRSPAGNFYLTKPQADALAASGQLPLGTWNGNRYFIKPGIGGTTKPLPVLDRA